MVVDMHWQNILVNRYFSKVKILARQTFDLCSTGNLYPGFFINILESSSMIG